MSTQPFPSILFYFGQHSLLAFFMPILITRDKTLSYL
ncbi:conserved hypothetical protein [Vibrio cholerae O1 str. 2010EL-1786]|uniref:Uncharacterized protein n=2 Tax=Vibrio cholerae TaxID=666 RepID=Q9KPJ2_VIBCH|nr:hypothetical protein VC_2375 [Vibrio cholerae O1 biovar El Tor str. N16961]ACP06599.1 conserved hypothetical protein [Vibrio cholerae M66-2]ACP10480.1 conserved hypothetical protein [Vibrio cholerae O395]AET27456.1 conserved hypothetical protein [Vibrio cholerae O1 str. 2010EL-1786]